MSVEIFFRIGISYEKQGACIGMWESVVWR